MTVVINATQARQTFFDLLVATRDKKQITKIMLDGKVIAKISPEEEVRFDWVEYEKKMKVAMKYLRKLNWDDVLEVRKNSKVRRYKGW